MQLPQAESQLESSDTGQLTIFVEVKAPPQMKEQEFDAV